MSVFDGKSFTQLTNLNILDELRVKGNPISQSPVTTRELGSFSTTATQNPTGQGAAGVIKVNFGAGGSTSGGELTVAPTGIVTTNIEMPEYFIEITTRIGRETAAGVAILHGRLMYAADGIEANAVQVGSTSTTEMDDTNTIWRERFEIRFSPAAGSIFWVEFGRDESGNDSGGILTQQPTGTLAGWNESDSAAISFSVFETA